MPLIDDATDPERGAQQPRHGRVTVSQRPELGLPRTSRLWSRQRPGVGIIGHAFCGLVSRVLHSVDFKRQRVGSAPPSTRRPLKKADVYVF